MQVTHVPLLICVPSVLNEKVPLVNIEVDKGVWLVKGNLHEQ